jgi:hypothetical protein
MNKGPEKKDGDRVKGGGMEQDEGRCEKERVQRKGN